MSTGYGCSAQDLWGRQRPDGPFRPPGRKIRLVCSPVYFPSSNEGWISAPWLHLPCNGRHSFRFFFFPFECGFRQADAALRIVIGFVFIDDLLEVLNGTGGGETVFR